MIEPGPVHTEFEVKMIQEVKQRDFPGADAETVRLFKEVYLPSSVDIFEALGQTPDDIARVRSLYILRLHISETHLTGQVLTVMFMSFFFLVHKESD